MLEVSSISELQARPELIDIIELVSKEKGISIDEVFEAMETAIKKIAIAKYGNVYDIRIKINRSNGAILIQKALTVAEESEDKYTQINLQQALLYKNDAKIGDVLLETLPQVSFDRNFVQPFRQIITKRVKEAEKEKEYILYKDKVGELVSGVVKRVELGNVFIELANRAEAFLKRDNTILRERLEVGDRVRALVIEVRQDIKGSQIVLSRSHPDFIKKLFEQEISEIYEGQIDIMAISRDAGSRSKVAVLSRDSSIDAVGSCIGFKGQRIQGILNELKGEKIDLVHYSNNIANFVINSFYPSQVVKVVVDEDRDIVEVVVRDENLSLAIGRGGQNINLISRLVGRHIDLMGEEAEKSKRQLEVQQRVAYLKESLDVDDIIAQLLVIEGFRNPDDILAENVASLSSIPAFNDDIIEELKNRASDFINNRNKEYDDKMDALGVDKSLRDLAGLTKDNLMLLVGEGVKTLNDLAELSTYDLLDILPKNTIDFKTAEDLIMLARESWTK